MSETRRILVRTECSGDGCPGCTACWGGTSPVVLVREPAISSDRLAAAPLPAEGVDAALDALLDNAAARVQVQGDLGERLRYEIAKLRVERDEARAENDVSHKWTYCPMCGSCGIGRCCGYFCDVCKERHDRETQDGSPPRDLGDLRLMQGGWKDLVAAAESSLSRAREALGAIVQSTRWNGDKQKHDNEWLRAALIRVRNIATGRIVPSVTSDG